MSAEVGEMLKDTNFANFDLQKAVQDMKEKGFDIDKEIENLKGKGFDFDKEMESLAMDFDKSLEKHNISAQHHGFTFHHLSNTSFAGHTDDSLRYNLKKWGFDEDLHFHRFRYEEFCKFPEDERTLLENFFTSPNVIHALNCTGISVLSPNKLQLEYEKLNTKVTGMSFFNKFEECGAISHTGHIRGRFDEDFEGIPMINLIREAIYMEESELYDAFSQKDRNELLFRIFQHLNVGGASNQYEDHVEEYFNATKKIYKDILSVRKNDGGDTEVLSQAYEIKSVGEGGALYTKQHRSNFTYLIVDPTNRSIILWRFVYKSIW